MPFISGPMEIKRHNNDRVKWCPVITYLEEEDVAMISDITMTGRDSLEFTAASKELSGDTQDGFL